ncbi:MAG: nodulation protein NfeD [Kouleothrix sp.]|nr:nodulation protein NfeD [Kouleothrix sp.]
MRRMSQVLALLALAALLVGGRPAPAAAQAAGPVYVAAIDGTVTSITTGYLRRVLRLAEASSASALIIRMSSTGAVLRDARVFAGEIAAARVPVVVYVAPAGTESGAAGALFLSAAHLSAMAPGTSFGSPYPLTQVDAALTQQTRDLVLDSVADQLRDWNASRGRNAGWLDQAVREGVVLTNEQASALSPPAVDLVAASQEELLTLLDGRQVRLQDGRTVQIATLGRAITEAGPTAWESVRLWLANPTIAFVLLVLGVLAICLEFAAPGSSVFAGIGAVLLVAAGLGLLVLPLRWWAALLLALALALIVVEFVAHAHGALAVTGLALLGVGSLNLIDPAQAPNTVIAAWVVVLVGLAIATVAALGVWLALRNRGRPIEAGQEAMVGKLAEVRHRLDPDGMVFVEGALWQAISEDGPAEVGDWVRVTATHNLRLVVRRLAGEEPAPPG